MTTSKQCRPKGQPESALPEPELAAGQVYIYAPTLSRLTLSKVTASRVSWPVEVYVGGTGKNKIRFAWSSRRTFIEGIKDGTYVLAEGGQ